MVIPAAATGASTTTSTAAPTQPALPNPPPHQVSPDSSSSRSSRSLNRSSNLNSRPRSSSSSSQRRPRGVGFSSQAWPTSARWLAAVGEAEADVEAPTRGAAAPGETISDSLGSINRQSRQQGGGEPERAGTLFADAERSVGPRRCTQTRVSFTGPVPRWEREVKQEL